MRKLKSLLLALVLGVALAGCGSLNYLEVKETVGVIHVEKGIATVHVDSINSIVFLEQMEAINAKGIKNLHLIVRSPGGGVIDLFTYIELLQDFKANGGKITSHITGWAASAAVPIYLMGDHRTIGRHSWMMLHPHSQWGKKVSDYTMDEEDNTCPTQKTLFEKFHNAINVFYCNIVDEETGMSCDDCLAIIADPDWDTNLGQRYYSAEEVLELGFAHEIV